MGYARCLIAAPHSGAGKTTVALGLMQLFREEGLTVRPFKCGPDYIDGKFHTLATDEPSINLDPFMMSPEHLKELFARYGAGADLALVEGVMGLFDGAKRDEGSSAEIAALLGLPVILVIDASAVAYSVAPLIHGFNSFKKGVTIEGVIFNRVNTASHYAFLKEACEDAGVTPFGHLPYEEGTAWNSRHLGLSTRDITGDRQKLERSAALLRQGIDRESLLDRITGPEPEPRAPTPSSGRKNKPGLKIAVASDEAFSFVYRANLDAMQRLGEVHFFSPIADEGIPEGTELLYISGGYPEDHLEELSLNEKMLRSIAAFSADGGRIIAECGGMMYLGRSIADAKGTEHPMTGVFRFRTSMEGMKRSLGYRKVILGESEFRGHEFHYSSCSDDEDYTSAGTVLSARDKEVDTKLFLQKRTFASYVHFYWGEGETLSRFLERIEEATKRTPS